MNSLQIDSILRNDYMTKHIFQGVYAVDVLPESCVGMYVINTDEHDQPGQHWVAVYNDEYFDSFGLPPLDQRIKDFLGYNIIYNKVTLQPILTNACGFYCVYYLLERARGQSMEDIIHVLKNDDGDFIVKSMIFNRYKPLFY